MKIEVRNDKVVIDGYVNAVGRDSRPISSPMGKFVEQIEPGAFRSSLAKRQDVDLLLNHRKDRRLGSTGGGELRLMEDSIGLRAHAEVSDSEVIEKARNGKLRGWSFGMYAGNDEFEERAGNIPRRHLKELDMFEVSLIDDSMLPCYAGTSVECRADGDVFSETRSFEDKVEVESRADVPVRDAAYWEKWLADTRARISIEDAEYRLWKLRNDFGADDSPEVRYNHNHDPTSGRFTSGGFGSSAKVFSDIKVFSNGGAKSIDKSEKSGIIKSSDIFTDGMTVKLPDGGYGKLSNGGKVTKIVTFAGKGTNKPIKVAKGLSSRFHNEESDWSKCRGDGYVELPDGSIKHSELHWFYSKQSDVFDLKVKRYFQ